MAYRDLTKRFMTLRNQNKDLNIPIRSPIDDNGPLLTPDDNKVALHDQLPPQWVELLDDIDYDIGKIQKQMGTLKGYHNKRTRITFEDTGKQDQQIQETTRSITKLFHQVQSKLKKIATVGNEENKKGVLPYQERMVRVSVMRSRGLQVQELSKKFRQMQRDYLVGLNKQNERSGNKFDNVNMPDFSNIHQGFNKEQQKQLELMEHRTDTRTKEIVAIAKSVHELAQLFHELSVLVVEQGSLLDRIDYNVEQTVESLQSAKVEIDKAEKYQKRSKSALCVLLLIVLVFVCAFILILTNL